MTSSFAQMDEKYVPIHFVEERLGNLEIYYNPGF